MISLYHKTENCYSLYGIDHFIEKFGLPIEVNGVECKICINYGVEKKGDFVIKIEENEILDKIAGKIKAYGEVAPIFEIPFDTGKGQVIAYYDCGEEIYPCITFSENCVKIGLDIFKETGYLLSGHLDRIWANLDEALKREIARIPVVDFYEELLFKSILYACERLGIPLVQKAFWPEGKKFAVCLTHDVDEVRKTYQWITRPLRYIRRGDFNALKGQFFSFIEKVKGKEPYWTFEEIIRIENEMGVKSTFFFLNESGKAHLFSPSSWKLCGRKYNLRSHAIMEIIQRLYSDGYEIGVHGSFYSYSDLEMLKKEKKELEEILGNKVIGIRQHHLNLEIPKTWRYQEEIGFDYDTSLGFKNDIGFKWGTCFPFHPFDTEKKMKMSLLEIPLIIMDTPLFLAVQPWNECIQTLNSVEKHRGVLTLLWHHTVFNKLEFPGWVNRYVELIRICQEKNAWIATGREIAKWWKMRSESNIKMFAGG